MSPPPASISSKSFGNPFRSGATASHPSYGRYWEAQRRTAWGAAHLDRVALVEQGRVTSSAKRYDLSARIDGRIRRVLGIGAVFTSPERRGRGGARRLLEMMLEAAEAEGYEYAMLFSEIDPAFYEALEFVPVPLLESRLEVKRQDGAPAVLVRAGDDRDLPAIAEMIGAIARVAPASPSIAAKTGSGSASRSGVCSPDSALPDCARSSSSSRRKAIRRWPM